MWKKTFLYFYQSDYVHRTSKSIDSIFCQGGRLVFPLENLGLFWKLAQTKGKQIESIFTLDFCWKYQQRMTSANIYAP